VHVAILRARIHVPEARSLKEKRQVVKSVLERARQRFGVAAAEVEDQDVHRVAVLGFAAVSESQAHAREVIGKVLETLRFHPRARLVDHQTECVSAAGEGGD
jgi:uncharacterized protein YlxP (DUF503 family)